MIKWSLTGRKKKPSSKEGFVVRVEPYTLTHYYDWVLTVRDEKTGDLLATEKFNSLSYEDTALRSALRTAREKQKKLRAIADGPKEYRV
jgi:hypothetical protein